MPAKKNNTKKTPDTTPADDYIVFDSGQGRNKKRNDEQPPATPRPDTRKIIGGQSWTGKLPVNLLSEHCQREKWNKPDYSMRQVPSQTPDKKYRSHVTLSKTDPKTRETTTIPSFDLPSSHIHLADQPTALEARHFAATYTLFRVASMKNIHMTLPPTYRDLWKGPFQELKQADVKEQRGWKYDADPFAAQVKRTEIHAAMEKRRADEEKRRTEKETTSTGLSALKGNNTHKWARAPTIELGEELRHQLETIVRAHTIWNTPQSRVSQQESAKLRSELTNAGFRPSHILEAFEHSSGRQEVLDWLLIHVPEDDLPPWALMSGYKAGISLASGDATQDAKVRRLTRAGYSTDTCLQALRDNNFDEAVAMEALQAALVPPPRSPTSETETAIWESELEAVSAVFAERFTMDGPNACVITSDIPRNIHVRLRLQKPSLGYPSSSVPIISIDAETAIPAYIRLSATKQALNFAWDSLAGEQMVFALVDWIETSLPGILENPGRLVDVDIASTSLKLEQMLKSPTSDSDQNHQRHRKSDRARDDKRSNAKIKQEWIERQSTPRQQKMKTARQTLPAWNRHDEIVSAINTTQVTIITGDTGSGKSTQSVQYILDDAINDGRGAEVNILCTQPRRIAALGLSDRLAAERCCTEGDEVGYIIRGDSKLSSRTKITFMTTGVLLRRLQLSKSLTDALQGVSHVFVDEVHERSLDTDFLLALLKGVLPQIPRLKVVCMSATVDADVFSSYFSTVSKVGRAHIEGRTFPVLDFYLDDILKMTGMASQNHEAEDQGMGRAIQGLGKGINYDLIASTVQEIDHQLSETSGGILIFLPGTMEIQRCLRALSNIPRIQALPLHASLLPAEQKRVFPPAPRGMRKVVVATNVAETSITIEDIVAVIDSGRVKETSYDSGSRMVRLQEVWASQASCRQRRGRAGRVRAGTCYKLFTRNVEASMRPHSEPEMRRVPLEQLCLSVKASSPDSDVTDFLSRVLSPPDSSSVSTALHTLHRMGALENDLLTGLGSSMVLIPADLRCAKLIIYGALYGCLESCLTVAAILSVRSPFISPPDKREEANAARARFSTEDGDLILDLSAFNEWKSNHGNRAWCEMNFLSLQTLRDVESTRQQLLESLKEATFVASDYHSPSSSPSTWPTKQTNNHYGSLNAHASNSSLLRALIAGALSPQIAAISFPSKKYIASMSGAKELDPEARTIKYYTEPTPNTSSLSDIKPVDERVFVHPSSSLFSAQTYTKQAVYLSYFNKLATSKAFIRDLTPLNGYSLLLFGGKIEVDVQGGGILVDEWLRLRGWARIGVLVSRLRSVVDGVIRRRIEGVGPRGRDVNDHEQEDREREREIQQEEEKILALVRRLVEMNGQDR